MTLKPFFTIALILSIFNFSNEQETPKSTQEILNNSFEQAKIENKNVFIIFTASWCGWCKKMDASIKDESINKLFTDNYIIEKLVVLERKGKKHLENFGSEDLLNKYGGKNQGIPFYLIFDSEGKLLADSRMIKGVEILKNQGSNIGCPGSDAEIDAFLYKLKETSNLTDNDLLKIAKRFKQNAIH
jgi:thiol-disulfide isomerase/thioredoxin